MAIDKEHVDDNTNVENTEKTCPTKVSRTVLDNFTLLTKAQPQLRKKGGLSLSKHLQTSVGSENGQIELKYALERIIRGLGSPKIPARAGFFSTYMVILTKIAQANQTELIQQIFDNIKKHLSTGKSNSKSENADISAGQILAYGALLRSRIFFFATAEQQQEILTRILTAGKKRFYLGLLAYEFIIELFNDMDEAQFKKLLLPILKQEICLPLKEQSLDSLYLLLTCHQKYPGVFNDKFISKNIGCSSLVNEETVKIIADIILNKPTLSMKHPLLNVVSKIIGNSDVLVTFFEEMDNLIARPLYTRHLIFSIIAKTIIEDLKDKTIIPNLLTQNFINHTLTFFKEKPNKKDELHQKLHQLFDAIVTAVKNPEVGSKIKLDLILKLLFDPGTFNFEQITKLKVIQQITSSLDVEGVKELAKIYYEVITDAFRQNDERFQNMDRLYAAQMLARILGHPVLQNEWDFKIEKMQFLMDVSLLENNKFCAVGSELASHLKTTFFRALDVKVPKLEMYKKLFEGLLKHAQTIINNHKLNQVSLRNKLSDEDVEVFEKAVDFIEKLEEKLNGKKKKRDLYLVFQVLFMHLSIQLFSDANLAKEAIEELFNCYDRVKHSKKKENEDCDDPEWIEVVIDLFLNLLSHNSHLLRSLVNYVFPYLCQHVNNNAIHQILSVLDPENTKVLQKRGKKNEEEEDSEKEDENNEEEEESEDNSDSDVDDDDMEDEEDDFDGEETTNDKLRQALQQVLGGSGYQTDEESINIDDISDTEMDKLDEALGQAFKQFKPNLGRRNKQSKSEETLTHFRLRSLDLLEIYIDNNPSMMLCLELIIPLLKFLEFTVKEKYQQPLQDRLKNVLAKLANVKKFSNTDGVDEKYLTNFISSVVERESFAIIQEIGESISDASKFILRCSNVLNSQDDFEHKKKLQKLLVKKYMELVNEFFATRDSLVPYVVLKDLANMTWPGIFKILPKLCEISFDTETKVFKRNQALNLVKIILTNNRLFSKLTDDKDEITDTIKQLFLATNDFMTSLTSGEATTNEKYVSSLFQLLTAVKKLQMKKLNELNWKELGENVRTYRSRTKLSKDAVTSFKALCKAIGVSNVVKMDLKNSNSKLNQDESDGEEVEMVKTKKKAQNKNRVDGKKQKKQARFERLKMSSEGLHHISFAKANLQEITEGQENEKMDVEQEENDNKPVKNKRKTSESDEDIKKRKRNKT